jgi:putative transposase
MARPLRPDFAGAIHHLFARGNRREPLFLDAVDYALYLRLLAGIVLAKKWRLMAYCLLPNHLHLLVETPEPNLARGMQHLHGLYARIFNDRHGFVGHVFQGRYGSKLVRDDRQFAAVARYIALNPVEAALCGDPADWDWASYGDVVESSSPAWVDATGLLTYFAGDTADPLASYVEFVSRGLPSPG